MEPQNQMRQLLEEIMAKDCEDRDTGSAEQLKNLAASYLDRKNLQVGDIVTWKDGLRNARWPIDGKPAVILDIISGQREKDQDSRGQAFMAPCDVRIGMLDAAGRFEAWWVDGNRLRLYEE